MPRPRSPLALALLLAFCVPPTRGQEPAEPAPADDGQSGQPWSVPDSQAVFNLLAEMRKAMEAGLHERAALRLQAVLDFHTASVVADGPAGDRRFVGARLWVHRFLRDGPPELMQAYRALAGPAARKLLDRAEASGDEALLREVLRRYLLSGHGPEALRATARLGLLRGRYVDAAHYLATLGREFPEVAGPRDLALLVFSLVRSGDAARATAAMTEGMRPGVRDREITIGDGTTTLGAFLGTLVPELNRLAVRAGEPSFDWPCYGGSPDGSPPVRSVGPIGPAEWTARTGYVTRDDDRETEWGSFSNYVKPWLTENHYPIHPVVSGGVVYYQNGSTVFARNLLTGNLLWSADGPIVRNNSGKTNPGTVHSLAVANGVVYANLEIPVPLPPASARQYSGRTVIFYIPRRRLFAFDAATGVLLWSHENEAARPEPEREILEDLNENSPPIVVGDTLYLAASRLENRYFCYALAVDARTGRILWRTRVCSGQQELNLFGRPIKELAPGAVAEQDGVLYLSSNLGVAAALDRRTGEIIWVRGYDAIPIPYSVQWSQVEERRPTWTNAPPVVAGETVYLTPTDSYHLLALDRATGAVRFRFHGGDPDRDPERYRRFLGVGPDYVYVAGSRLAAIDRRSGKLVWRSNRGTFEARLPGGERKEEAWGRGAVTRDAVWLTTQLGLYSFDPRTGQRLTFEPMTHPATRRGVPVEAGGNIVFSGNVMVLAGQDNLTAFYEKNEVYEQLRRRAEEAPGDAGVALELGEIYMKWGRYEEAVAEYERVLRFSPALPPDDRARLEFTARKGLFGIHMGEGAAAREAMNPERAAEHFRAALASAVDDEGRIRARLALAEEARRGGRLDELAAVYEALERELGAVVFPFPAEGEIPAGLFALLHLTDLARDAGKPEVAIRHLSRIIAEYPDREIAGTVPSQDFAREAIGRILDAEGREAYAPLEAEAGRRLKAATAMKSPDDLSEVIRLYPNSRAAETASMELGRLLLLEGDYRRAAVALRRILAENPESDAAPTVLLLLSRALELRGYLVSAKSALVRLADRYGDARIEVDGAEVRAADWAAGRLAEPQFAALASRAPRVSLPLEHLWTEDEGSSSYVRILEPLGAAPPGTEGTLLLGTNGLLEAVDANRHAVTWRREMNGIVTRPLAVEGVYVLVNQSSVTGVDPDRGSVLWELPVNATIRAVGTSPGAAFVLTADYRDPTNLLLRAISPRTGEILWSREIVNQQLYDVLLVTEESIGLAAREPAGITVLDVSSGRIRFQVEMMPRSLYREPFLVDDDKLFLVHGNQKFDLYEMSSGRLAWSGTLPGDGVIRSAIPVPRAILLTDTQENLLLVDAASGKLRWSAPADAENPLQYQGETADAERAFVVRKSEANDIYFVEARDLESGKVAWRADLVTAKSATPAPIVTEDCLIWHVNSYDFGRGAWTSKSLFLDRRTGETLQVLEPPDLQGFFTYAVLRDGIFCLNARGKVSVFGTR